MLNKQVKTCDELVSSTAIADLISERNEYLFTYKFIIYKYFITRYLIERNNSYKANKSAHHTNVFPGWFSGPELRKQAHNRLTYGAVTKTE